MTQVVLHVGQPKAASSSIQRALWDNRAVLAEAGIAYPVGPRKQHGPAVAELMVKSVEVSDFASFTLSPPEVGGWERLCREARSADRAIVSAEMLSLCSSGMARDVVRDLCVDGPPSILVCVRRPSEAVISSFTQVVRVQPTVACETWVRASLRGALMKSHRSVINLHNPLISRTWSEFGAVELVDVDDRAPEDLDGDVISALGLDGVVRTPFLSRRNASPSAARLVAWQRLQSRRPDPAVLKAATVPIDTLSASLPGAGGRFHLTEEVAELVDLAFPTRDETPAAEDARDRLMRRLSDPTAMTHVGMDDKDFNEAVSMCLMDLEARLA
jgi:hypothetical protein